MQKILLPPCVIRSTDPKIPIIRGKLKELLDMAKLSADATIPSVKDKELATSIFGQLSEFLGLRSNPAEMNLSELNIDTSDEAFALYKRLEAELTRIVSGMGLLCDSTGIDTRIAFIRMILLRTFAQAADTKVEALIANKDLKIFDLVIEFVGYLNHQEFTIHDYLMTRDTTLLGWTHRSLPGLVQELKLEIIKHCTLSKHKMVIRELADALRLLGNYAKACVLVSLNPESRFTKGELNVDQLDYHYMHSLDSLKEGKLEKTLTLFELYKFIDPVASLSAGGGSATSGAAVATSTVMAYTPPGPLTKVSTQASLIESMRLIIHTELDKGSSVTKDILVRVAKLNSSYQRLFILSYLFCYKVGNFSKLISAMEDLIAMTGVLLFLHYSFSVQGMNSVVLLLESHCRMIVDELGFLHAYAASPPVAITALYKTLPPLEIAVKRLADIPADLEALGTVEHRKSVVDAGLAALHKFAVLAKPYGLVTPFFSELERDERLSSVPLLEATTGGGAAGAGAATDLFRLTREEVRRKLDQIENLESLALSSKEGSTIDYAREAYRACEMIADYNQAAYKRLLYFKMKNFGISLGPEARAAAETELNRLNGAFAAAAVAAVAATTSVSPATSGAPGLFRSPVISSTPRSNSAAAAGGAGIVAPAAGGAGAVARPRF